MKKSKLSLFLTASTLLISGASLTSCGASEVTNAGEAFEMKTIQDLKDNSSEDSPIEITFWHSFGDTIEAPLNGLIDDFEDEMASQSIYIDVKALSTGGGYDGLRSKINSGVASNNLPTMLLGYPDHFADYINSGILLPLDSYVNSTDENIGMIGDYAYSDIIDEYKRENNLDIDGDGNADICGIPFNKSTEVMYYNASAVDPILEENGWIGEDGYWENPTWDQLWTVSQTLRNQVAGGTCSWTYKEEATYESIKTDYPVYIDSESNFFITTARQWCSSQEEASSVYTTSTSVSSGEARFDNSITRSAQSYFLEKANANLWNLPAKKSQGYGSKLMANLEAFISIGSTAGVKNNASPKYELKVTTVPQRSYDDSSIQAVIQQGTNAAILSKNSNNLTRLAAWLLIRYMTSTESTTTFSMDTGYLPVRQSAINSTTYQNFLSLADAEYANKEENKYQKALYGTVAQAVYSANKSRSYFYTDPAFKGSSTIRDKLEKLVQTIFVTGKSIDFAYKSTYNQLKKEGITCISESR